MSPHRGKRSPRLRAFLLCERLGKVKYFKSATPLKPLRFIFHWGGGKGRGCEYGLSRRPASSWWRTSVTKEVIGSVSVVKTKVCCTLDSKSMAEKTH